MKAHANGIDIEYESVGAADAPAVILINGWGGQLISWDEEFCQRLVSRGFRVIRFDNRDVGLSTWFDEAGVPDVVQETAKLLAGEQLHPPFTIDDMADDVAGLLGALGIDSAHVVGVSMGAGIALTMAYRHPERVRTLTTIMAGSGDPSLPPARPEVMAQMMRGMLAAATMTRDEYVEMAVETARLVRGLGVPFDEERVRCQARRGVERAFHPHGVARQGFAGAAQGPRISMLRELRVPALVMSGTDDPLTPIAHARHLAECVPGAHLLEIEGMGHEIVPALWDHIAAAIADHACVEEARRSEHELSR